MIIPCHSVSVTEWLKNGVAWPPRPSPVYHRLPRAIILDEPKQHDSGQYTCVGTYRDIYDGQEKPMRSDTLLLVGGIMLLLLGKES